jgi:signal transduction histidine kinase
MANNARLIWPLGLLASRGAAALCLALPGALPAALSPAPPQPVLTRVQQVLDLGVDGARLKPHPVRLRGVVTLVTWEFDDSVFIQDETGGILVTTRSLPPDIREGMLLEAAGTTTAGSFYVFIKDAELKVVGEGSMPEPRRFTLAELNAGEGFGQWHQIEGVVRDVVSLRDGHLILRVASQGHWFFTRMRIPSDLPLPAEWLDARVELRGIPLTFINSRNNPNGFDLHVSGTNFLRIIDPGTTNLFERPLLTAQALRPSPPPRGTRRRVRGVVTHVSPTGWFSFEDATGPMRAEGHEPHMGYEGGGNATATRRKALRREFPDTNQWRYVPRPAPPELHPGDVVELVGSPATGEAFAPRLTSSEYRVVGREKVPVPVAMPASDVLSGKYDARLVQVRARVMDRESYMRNGLFHQTFWLEADDVLFEAMFISVDRQKRITAGKNAYVEVAGLCNAIPGELQQVRSFRLRLSDRADMRVLGGPPAWWRSEAVLRAFGVAGTLGLAALGWIALLRRQVKRQTVRLRHALERERELGEMKSNFVSLVSHEFRTPLGVIMSATEVLQRYLDRLAPEKRARHLDMIFRSTKNLAALMDEVLVLGRVQDGRTQFRPGPVDLELLCRTISAEVVSASGAVCPVHWNARSPLAGAVSDESLLRPILNNLLSNAVKYSEPGSPVDFDVEQRGTDAIFTVRDRGIGIPAEDRERIFQSFNRGGNVGDRPGTGLGLVIVERCVKLHGGQLRLESEPGQGTTVTVSLPVFGISQPSTQASFSS